MSVSKDKNAEENGKVLNNCAYVEQDKTDQYAFNQSHSLDKKVIKSTKTTDGVTGSMTVDEKKNEDVSKTSKVMISKTKDLKNTSKRETPEKSEHLHLKESEDETTIKKSKQATKQASKDSDTKNMPQSKKHTPMSNVKIKRPGQNITRQPPEISRKDISKTKTKLSMSRITDEKFKPTVVRSSIDSDSKLISKSKFKDSNANLKRDNLGSNTSPIVNHIKDKIKTKHIESKLKEMGENTDLHISEPFAAIDTTIILETRTHRPVSYMKMDKTAPKLSQQDSHHSNLKIKHISKPRTTPADLDSKDTFGIKTTESNLNKGKIQTKHKQPSKLINSKDISEQQTHHLKTTLKWKKSEVITSTTTTAFGNRNKSQRKTHESKSYTTENKNEADIKRSSAFVEKERSNTKTGPSKNISKESKCLPSFTPKSIKEIDDKGTQNIRAKLNDTERTSITSHKQKISVMKDNTPSSNMSQFLTNNTCDVETSDLAGECNTQKAHYLTTSSPSPAHFQQSMSISKSPVNKENQITSNGIKAIKVARDRLSKNNELPLKRQRSIERLENSSMQTEIKTSKDFKQSFLQRKAWVKSETDLKTETTVKRNETSQKCMIHETKTYFDENSQDKSPERDRAAESGRRGNEVQKTVIKKVENYEILHKISTPEKGENESGRCQNNLIGENRIVKTDSGENAHLSNPEIKLEDIECNIVESGVCLSLKKDVPTAFNLEASNKTAETTSRPSSVEVVDKCRDDGNSRNINTKRSESSADKNDKKNEMPTDFDDFTGHNKHFSPNAKIDNFTERDEKQNSNKNTFKSQTNEKRPKLFSFQKISPSDKKALFNGQKESRIDEHAFLKSKPVSQGSSSIQSTVEIGGKLKSEEKREPPDDFRHYPTSPTIDEITSVTKPFLRPVKVTGSYENLHDYLDVYFRLFREDFVGPLRDGITGLIKIMSAYKGQASKSERIKELDMKIYENVRVLSPVVTQQGLCYKMKLQMTPNLRNIEWKFSKRLIYGSMVCLTDKDFTEFFLATVVEREDKDIRRGYFVVHFETQNIDMKKLHRKMFIMAETSGYFEAYRHVLSSLKTCKDGDLPFEKYIVSCKKSVGYPAYLNQNHNYDLRPLVDQDVKLKANRRLIENKVLAVSTDNEFSPQSYPAKEVHLTRLRNWPSKELLRMDDSQYRAVQSALTRELAIIQGPPGTGKTYIGLQIVKTLLHNKSVWTETGQSIKPMLIVCYTNHALDQFLEGILNFYKGDILRVGGRSNSEDLEGFNLKAYRKIKFKKGSKLATLQFNKRVARRNIEAQSRCVQDLAKRIQLFQSEIVNEDTLSEEIGDRLFKSLIADFNGNVKQANFSYIVKWLGVEYMKKECVKELRKARNVRKVKHVRVEDEIARTLQERMLDFDADTHFASNERFIVRKIRNSDIAFHVEESKGQTRRRKNDSSKEEVPDKFFNKTFKTTLVSKITDEDVMSQEEADTIKNVWRLDHKTKWRLYRLWIKKKCTALYDKIEEKKANFEAASESYRDALQQVDKAIMQKAVVVGMTTSGAARYQSVLREIGPKIIVVEEAAEVLEAHIISTLSNKCEHLILIGDHKQLRPNPTVYELVVKYNFDISLFERMVKNGIEFNCLELQHRMRPEISSIMRHIYPDLKDHEQVSSYPNVKGVSTNLFLVNHSHMEICSDEIKSYSNPQEAEYAVALCRYLLLQGYKKDEITILTTYSGQLMYFRNLMSEEEFDGVHITVVDNYQGEENQIVILSLVRSNNNAKIGFLKTENRICVALSRAKVGLFIIANFDHLSSHSSLWERITVDMKNKNHFGEGLVLYCQNHPNDDPIVAIKAEDFQKAPEGGCFKKCDTRLKCGHKCVLYCHVIDKEHNEIKCKKPCTKILCDLGHKCPDKCFIECSPCQVLVTKIIPKCGHTQVVPCATKPEEYCCQEPCSTFLECSHMCKEKCGDDHTTECDEKVQFTWPCEHSFEIMCWETKTKVCPQPCGLQLKCKHTCSGTCASCFNGRMHQQCRHGCSVTHPCGHKSSALCQHNPLCSEPCENRCSHKKCTKKCGDVCTPCHLPCSWKCIHKRCTRRCGEICNRNACNFPCGKNLKCNHKCIGLCGEPCPSICRLCHKTKFKAMTFGKKQKQNAHYVLLEQCGHLIEYQAMDTMMKRQTKSKEIRCPKCTTIIKHCLRYGNIIKTYLSTIERSKKIAIGNLNLRCKLADSITDISEESESDSRIYAEIKQGTISEDVARTKYTSHFYKLFCKKELGKRLDSLTGVLITERQLLTIEKQWKICIDISDLIQRINDTEHDMRDSEKGNNFVSFLHKLITIVVQPRSVLTDQENEDIDREIRRGKTYLKFLKIGMSAIPMSVTAKIRDNFKTIESDLLGTTQFIDELDRNVNKSIGGLGAEIEMYYR